MSPGDEGLERQRLVGPQAHHLPAGVDPGIGAPGGGRPDRLVEEARERPLQRGLDRGAVGLDLPADVVGAVVLEDEVTTGAGETYHGPWPPRPRPSRPRDGANAGRPGSGPGAPAPRTASGYRVARSVESRCGHIECARGP